MRDRTRSAKFRVAARTFAALILPLLTLPSVRLMAQGASDEKTATAATSRPGILNAEQAAAILPATVFFRGQTAPIQARNSGGMKFEDGALFLVALVDTSGYSSTVQQSYQGYLVTEVPLQIGGHSLPSGAYGFGFLADNQMIVMDLGGHPLFKSPTAQDTAMRRPRPLQVVAGSSGPLSLRLYLGRSFATIESAVRQP